jgi:hypothetical protein
MKHTLTILFVLLAATAAWAAETKLWYDKPATVWEAEALPIGNGRLGAMVFGGVDRERIQFNEDSLWIGDETDTGAYQAFGDLFIEFAGGGAVTNYRITSPEPREVKVRVNGEAKTIRSEKLKREQAIMKRKRTTRSAPFCK